MKKYCLLFICLLFMTGCSVTYNLDIDEDFTENITIEEKDESYFDYKSSSLSMMELKNYYISKPLTLSTNEMMSESTEKIDGVSYYEVKDISNAEKIGLSLDGKFDGFNSESLMVWQACGDYSISKNSTGFTINASYFKIFEQYENLENITINLKTDYEVTESNADSVNNGVYSWFVTDENYEDKFINMEIRTAKKGRVTDESMTTFGIAVLIVVLAGVVIYFIVRFNFRKKNSL